MAVKNRLHRSELAVPGSNPKMLAKAPTAGADMVFLDLEDAVAPEAKEVARRNVIEALISLDWSSCSVSVRINGLDTPYCYQDIIEVVEKAGSKLDVVLIPKVNRPEDVYFVATLLSQIEQAKNIKPIGLCALIETAAGVDNVREIARACPDRLEALVFGVADYAASIQARTTSIGGVNPDYAVLTGSPGESRELHFGDPWHFALARMVVACRANGLRPIDGPFGDINDPAGYLAAARRAAALGCEGKWAIHPSQISLANEVFTPSAAEVERAERILAALEQAADQGKGAVALDGRMIDAASIRMAQNLLAKMEQINHRKKSQ